MPLRSIRIALLQLNPTVGDLTGNSDRILRALRAAEGQGAVLAVTPELSLTGYPPEDLLLRPAFIDAASRSLRSLAKQVHSTTLVCGYPERLVGAKRRPGPLVMNTAAVLRSGRHLASYHKMALPNYGVFDELRYFRPGRKPLFLDRASGGGSGARIAVSICEDLWPEANGLYLRAPELRRADIILNLSASPYDRSKHSARLRAAAAAARSTGAHIIYVNLVGGQDELVFDGRSFVMSPAGRVMIQAKAFTEDLVCVDVPLRAAARTRRGPAADLAASVPPRPATPALRPGSDEDVLAAVELSLKDYVRKNGFGSVGIAMSGGIDSALVAAIAVRALGAGKVIGVTLPSLITSSATLADAERQARSLGITFYKIPIASMLASFLRSLRPVARGIAAGAMEENLQARIRGTLMMALSNHLGFLLLATGNKSELATGYCTLYGDMAGGFAPLKDLTKEWVYRLARLINCLDGGPTIPLSVLRRAPTAELKPGQKDQDSLPPYPVLDAILEALIENDRPAHELGRGGKLRALAARDTARRVQLNEYKRRQAPIGPRISAKAFGRDRRMPVTQSGGAQF